MLLIWLYISFFHFLAVNFIQHYKQFYEYAKSIHSSIPQVKFIWVIFRVQFFQQ